MELELTFDTVIVGAGATGLYTALHLPQEESILILCKGDMDSCDSMLEALVFAKQAAQHIAARKED